MDRKEDEYPFYQFSNTQSMAKKRKRDSVLMSPSSGDISMVTEFEAVVSPPAPEELLQELPIMTLRNIVIFPNVLMPVTMGRESTVKLAERAYKNQELVVLATQKHSETEAPLLEDLYPTAVIGRILRIIEIEGRHTAFVQALGVKVNINEITTEQPYLRGLVSVIMEEPFKMKSDETKALLETCKELAINFIELSESMPAQVAVMIRGMGRDDHLVNNLCTHFYWDLEEKMRLLNCNSMTERAYQLIQLLQKELQLAALRQSIQMRTREDLDKQQKEYFLQQQMRNIMDELGTGQEDDVEDLREKAKKKKWSEAVQAMFDKELQKLSHTNAQSPDYNVQLTYLQTLLDLPWEVYTHDNLNIQTAEKVLNKDHYGLEKVKERILEHLAVLKLRSDQKSPIICLYGPPGVGKTSLGKSIATALKRKYVRMSLGGLHDEAEIRGHRRTYIGAMPGRILKGLIKAGSSNPVVILDEIDKLGRDHRGDPSSALLEVLDPEQNNTFHDNYVDLDYDLSKVMFIATANNISSIPTPLLDRMEMIEVSGYITEEKCEIAKRHLLPKAIEANGMKGKGVKISRAAIEHIIENYTRESGVRELEKKLNKLLRKIALLLAKEETVTLKEIKPADVEYYLGAPEYSRDRYQGNDYAGVVTGLAWTAVGGEILFVETSLSKGKGGKLTLTGNLGDVMKESAVLALEYLKAHNETLGIPAKVFEQWNVHVHVPEGAIPKDGPSAGITMVTSLASAFTQRKVKDKLAMTGEITLRGKVLPVGGIREKILAAKRAGIREIILCQENKKHIDEISAMYLEGLTFHYVNDIQEVLNIALTDEKVSQPLELTVE